MAALLVGMLGWLARALSRARALALGEFLGSVWFSVVRIRRGTVLRQLAQAFPARPRGELREIARRLYRNLGRWAVEFLRVAGRTDAADELRAAVTTEGARAYDEAAASGGGAIVATAHLGNWDLAACAQALAGRRLTLLSRRLTNRGLDRKWMAGRRALGLEIVDEDAKLEELAGILRRGGTLVLLIDQATPPERGGVRIDFFGTPAWTTRLPALLALRTGAPIFPVFVDSGTDGRHVVRYEEAIRPGGAEGSVAERTLALTRELNERLEHRVREDPAQWLWLHRRWKDLTTRRRAARSPNATPRDPPES